MINEIKDCLDKNDIEKALELILENNERYKDNIDFMNMKSIIYIKIGEYEIAINNLILALIINPYNLDANYNLAYAYEKNGQIDKSIEVYITILNYTVDYTEKQELLNMLNDDNYKMLVRSYVNDLISKNEFKKARNLLNNCDKIIKDVNFEKLKKVVSRKNKKIYFVLEHLGGQGGVEAVLTSVVNELERRGYTTAILLPNKSDNYLWEYHISNVYYYNAIKSYEIRDSIDLTLSRISGLSETINKIGNPDIIIGTHMPITVLYSRLAVGYKNTKVCSWIHSPFELHNYKKVLNYADIHIGMSENIANEIKSIIDFIEKAINS